MSEHPDIRDLLGPYVMGTLEPYEEREVEDHLQGCASCTEEAQELRLAHERLADLAYSTVAPPEDLKARVVAEIPRREASRRVPTWVAAVAAAFCVLAVLGAIITPDLLGGRDMASASLSPTGLAPGAGGDVTLNAPNFAASYPGVGVTAEYDKDPRASDAKMLSGELHEL